MNAGRDIEMILFDRFRLVVGHNLFYKCLLSTISSVSVVRKPYIS